LLNQKEGSDNIFVVILEQIKHAYLYEKVLFYNYNMYIFLLYRS